MPRKKKEEATTEVTTVAETEPKKRGRKKKEVKEEIKLTTETVVIKDEDKNKRGRKKKPEEVKITKPETEVTVTDEDIAKAQRASENPMSGFEKITVRNTRHKYYEDGHNVWVCERLILRVNNEDYIRKFDQPITISKDKINKLTRYDNNKWGKISEIREENSDLVFVLLPVEF